MTDIILPVVLAAIASTGFWTFINTAILKERDRKSCEKAALLALLHNRIFILSKKAIERGYITEDEYQDLLFMFEPYSKMGGNGMCHKLKEEVDKLPLRKE